MSSETACIVCAYRCRTVSEWGEIYIVGIGMNFYYDFSVGRNRQLRADAQQILRVHGKSNELRRKCDAVSVICVYWCQTVSEWSEICIVGIGTKISTTFLLVENTDCGPKRNRFFAYMQNLLHCAENVMQRSDFACTGVKRCRNEAKFISLESERIFLRLSC